MTKILYTVIALSVVLTWGQGAMAQEVVYQQHQVVDFGDDTIDGNLSRPDGQYLESQKTQMHRRLIKVRRHFRPQILQSVRVL